MRTLRQKETSAEVMTRAALLPMAEKPITITPGVCHNCKAVVEVILQIDGNYTCGDHGCLKGSGKNFGKLARVVRQNLASSLASVLPSSIYNVPVTICEYSPTTSRYLTRFNGQGYWFDADALEIIG